VALDAAKPFVDLAVNHFTAAISVAASPTPALQQTQPAFFSNPNQTQLQINSPALLGCVVSVHNNSHEISRKTLHHHNSPTQEASGGMQLHWTPAALESGSGPCSVCPLRYMHACHPTRMFQ
jgi:hypothetical protein